MSNLDNAYGIIPSTGEYETDWPVHFNIPQGASGGISTGGWTADNLNVGNFGNEGFIQQTFLGASILDFDLSAGFGDSASTMSINLVNDEFNVSDQTSLGQGDDPYHNGQFDYFMPPVVGTPVFFKFGKNPATIEQAFRQTFDDLYGIQTLPPRIVNNPWGYNFTVDTWDENDFNELPPHHLVDREAKLIQDRSILWNNDTYWRGRAHFNFGGILQSYTQNKGNGGKPTYSVQLTDPREILSNVTVLLNNYQGTTFNNKNLINVYGFLEYDPSEALLSSFSSAKAGIVTKLVNAAGNVNYIGVASTWNSATGWEKSSIPANVDIPSRSWLSPEGIPFIIPGRTINLVDQYYSPVSFGPASIPQFFPITGQGFSRRSDKGMPFYRVSQALAALFQYHGFLPAEYKAAGFGGVINFRGYNYVVDFSGIPTDKIPLLYYMDFDQIDLLSLAQELCDIISHSLYVTLLPVINHPACEFLYNYNNYQVSQGTPQNIIAGIIRLDAIDKTKQPQYGAIKAYLDNLQSRGINVEGQDVGYELSNVTTDKFVVGAQEVETYFFSTERDRDNLWTWNQENNSSNMLWLQQFQWDLRTQEQQQVLPYYGMLGNKAVSIPRGFGSYQQILLDATSLNAYGVGNYYVATEMELRAALISYEKWKNFLLSYNEVYIEDVSELRGFYTALGYSNSQVQSAIDTFESLANIDGLTNGPEKERIQEMLNGLKGREYTVSVPRCVWHSDKPFVDEFGYPRSPCSPPFGYPLYYRRATSIGIVEAGIGKIVNAKTKLVQNYEHLQSSYENLNSPMMQLPKETLESNMKELGLEAATMAIENFFNPNAKADNAQFQTLAKKYAEASEVFNNFDTIRANLQGTENAMAHIENLEDGPLGKFLFNIEKTAKRHDENARKVYDFVKSVAEECLGKKFLVRLPKSCNLGYSQSISTFGGGPFNIKNGPFGFPPKPISSDPLAIGGVYYDVNSATGPIGTNLLVLNQTLNSNPSNLWHHYLQDYTADTSFNARRPLSQTYSFGALKGNFNPFIEDWEWNYKPEPQGGFFGFNLFGVNISALQALRLGVPWNAMPPAIQQGLCPLDMTNLLSDSHRVQCYVRYNHSELLDFTGVSPNDMVQQVMTKGGQFIPDVVQELPNGNIDQKTRFEAITQTQKEQAKKERQPDSMAFVKCSVEEKLYMPPKLGQYSLDVFGRDVAFSMAIPKPKVVQSKDPQTGCSVPEVIYPVITPVFKIPKDGGKAGSQANWVDFDRRYDAELDAWIINTDLEQLDDEHVYALITVPGRIKSIIDTRWNDGQNQNFQAMMLKHLMTQDVVRIPEFSQPSFPNPGPPRDKICGKPQMLIVPEDATGREIQDIQNQAKAIARGMGLGDEADYITDQEFGLPEGQSAYIPGKVSDWLTLSLEDVTSARKIAKGAIQAAINDSPDVFINYVQPSPVYPDIVALPLMSMERCYGPWMSASQLNPQADPRIKYSDIGGKVEFIKDENLAPWNYAGYQLMNEAGSLQAQFSNSLLLFSERGGFSFPDAPTGIALAKALQFEGPLITSIGINVSQGGVKTTVKLDLYTSQWGKLAKQKEMAISQVARERQKLRDEQNSAIRRGLGKRATSADLVNTVMNAGGSQVMGLLKSVTSQLETNRELGKKISESVLAVGCHQAVSYSDAEDLNRVLNTTDANSVNKQLDTVAIATPSDLHQAYSTGPHQHLPSQEISQMGANNILLDPSMTRYT